MEFRKAVHFIFLMCCAVKINGEDEAPPDLTFLSTEQKEVVRKSKSKLELAATIADSLAQSAYTQVLVSANSFSEKLSTAKSKVRNLEKNILGDSGDDAEGKAERISGALEGVGDGLVGMIQGIKGGDWVQGVQGALGIVSSIVALAGPIGMIASSILSMMSSFFGLFGGSEAESQESMIKRVVEAAISDFRDKDMKEDIEGVKQVYQSLSSSVQNFRERKRDMSASQAEELYNQIFMGLPVFGKLKARIGEKCEKPGNAATDNAKVTACLNFVKLYSEVSILRQLILADMASLLSELSELSPSQAHLKTTGNNILHIIKKEQENDKAILAPFADPVNHKEKRYTIAILYTSIEEYKVLNSYMQSLHEKRDGIKKTGDTNVLGGSIFKEYVLGCEHRMLQGVCVRFDTTAEYKKLSEIDMDKKVSSVFIPRGRSITAYKGENFGGGELGPFIGAVVHGQVDGEDNWRSLKVEATTESIDTQIRFCENENMDASLRCDSIKQESPIQDIDLSTSLQRFTTWSNKIQSIYVPAGKMVTGFTTKDADPYGPYIGPQLVNKVCHPSSSKWKFLKLGQTEFDAQTLVLFCESTNLKGKCYRDQAIARFKLDKVLGECNVKDKIQSLKIPGGKQVTGFNREDLTGQAYGPYIGPITVNEVDAKTSWKSYKIDNTPPITTGKKKKKAARRLNVKELSHRKKHKENQEESEEE